MERKKQAIERRKALKEKNKKLKEQKLLENKVKIVLDWEHGVYYARKALDNDKEFIYVDKNIAKRWFLMEDSYSLYQQELHDEVYKQSNKK